MSLQGGYANLNVPNMVATMKKAVGCLLSAQEGSPVSRTAQSHWPGLLMFDIHGGKQFSCYNGKMSTVETSAFSFSLPEAVEKRRNLYRCLFQHLQEVYDLIAKLCYYPVNLLVVYWVLRGYLYEKTGEVEIGCIDYQQALNTLINLYGDPRVSRHEKRHDDIFGFGHPLGLFLSWKLGQISYCRGDVGNIDKFSNIYRALRLYWDTVFT